MEKGTSRMTHRGKGTGETPVSRRSLLGWSGVVVAGAAVGLVPTAAEAAPQAATARRAPECMADLNGAS